MPATTRRTTKLKHANVGELLDSLGVSASRVCLDPPPGRATKRDLLKLDAACGKLHELVERTLVEKVMGFAESVYASELGRLLGNFVAEHNLGFVGGADALIEFAPSLVRLPDVCFVSWDRCPDGTLPTAAIAKVIPNLVVEVLSRSNTETEIARKRGEYFRAGVELVWEIDPAARTAVVHTGPMNAVSLKATGTLDGGTVLPGFTLPLAKLFDRRKPTGK